MKNHYRVNRGTVHGLVKEIYYNQWNHSKERGHHLPVYTRKELHEWIISQPNFKDLFNNWIKSGMERDLVPSVDRIDDYKSYTIDNIQLVTFRENYTRLHTDKINGINNKNSRAVNQYNKDGEFIDRYYSLHNAWRVTGIEYRNIHKVCRGERNHAGGYKWEYAL